MEYFEHPGAVALRQRSANWRALNVPFWPIATCCDGLQSAKIGNVSGDLVTAESCCAHLK